MPKFLTALHQPMLARSLKNASWVSKGVAVLIGSLLLAASAQIQVPMYPIPMSMQTYAVLILGALGGRWIGLGAIAAYLLEGAMGFPVFVNGASGAAFFGPTGGFLFGFLLSGAVAAFAAERGLLQSWTGAILWLGLAHLIVFIPGVLWLATFFGFEQAWVLGFMVFVPGSLLKTGLAAITVRKADPNANPPQRP